jgi:tetratricopeptide (TPR) repeat protein
VKLRTRPRTFLLLLLLALVWAAARWLLPLADGSQNPPQDTLGLACQRFLAAAEKAGARDVSPRALDGARDSLQRARFEMNLQLAGRWGTRDFDRPVRLMDQAQREAFRLWSQVRSHQRMAKQFAGGAIHKAEQDLAEAEELGSMSAQEPYLRGKLALASILLNRARAYEAAGKFDQALAAASESSRNSERALSRSREVLSRFDDPSHLRSWKIWQSRAVQYSASTGNAAFVVIKERHRLDVYKGGRLVRSMEVDLGANSVNQKLHAGDRTTPEGLYHIVKKKPWGQSKYGCALLLDYPNAEDRSRFSQAKSQGLLTRRTGIGGLIEIHGDGGRGYDWTDGCVAPSNEDMKVLYNLALVGTPVAIVGSDGGDGPVRSLLKRAEHHP